MSETLVKHIRINKEICDALEAEAKELHIKFPAIVGRALGEYVARRNRTLIDTSDDAPLAIYSLDIIRMLWSMNKDDLRTLNGQLEYLIRQEYARRNHTLIDTQGRYEVEMKG